MRELQHLLDVRVANATGFTVAQVRTINACEAEHVAAYQAEVRAAQRFEPFTPQVEAFKVERDPRRTRIPVVTWYDPDMGCMREEAVLKDGTFRSGST